MCESAKSQKAQQTAAQSAMEAEQKAGAANLAAGLEAQNKIIQAGATTPAETERLNRYTTNATTPGETLLQNQGPISQAVARRIQERVDQPGLDYTTNQAAFTEGVTQPLWAALKARGIVPPPGAEGGGGLATQQYMKGAEPALAELRANQINTDITRGQTYGQTATAQQNYFTDLENTLSQALQNRILSSTEAGVPYAVQGTQLQGQGMTAAEAINQTEVQSRYARIGAEKEAIGNLIAQVLTGGTASYSPSATTTTPKTTAMPGGFWGGFAQGVGRQLQSSLDLLLQKRATQAITV